MVKSIYQNTKNIVYIDFNPTKGHEQSGFRPALVISNEDFNKFTKMVIVCQSLQIPKSFQFIMK